MMIEILDALMGISFFLIFFTSIYMRVYLDTEKAIDKSIWDFNLVFMELVFRYRDYTKFKNGKIGTIYYIYLSFYPLLIGTFAIRILTSIDLSHIVAKIFVGIFGLILFPVIGCVFYLQYKEKYY